MYSVKILLLEGSVLCAGASYDLVVSNEGQGVQLEVRGAPTASRYVVSSWLLLRELDILSPMLDPDAEERLFLFLRMVRGCSLGARLKGRGVTVHVDGALCAFAQFRKDESKPNSGGDSQMLFLISLMISSSGPWFGWL
jgi:hypothetical protein|tara:strand:- start:4794 stop:5210 length:417 start_codon:yes stop_codon:yes gene_type:complete